MPMSSTHFRRHPIWRPAIAALPGQKYLAAHSLGNNGCVQCDRGSWAQSTRYFMIDAAVAMEATNQERYANEMVCSTWLAYSNTFMVFGMV
jgi:hypothetical protein